jgi:uncharacterized LabA/DUF88 family protein
MNRVTFLIDGFNIYHSTLDLKRRYGICTKWLDLTSLCKSYIALFGKGAKVQAIYYFSAIADYLITQNPDKIKRHREYIACLQSTGINVELARFKEKEVFCDRCRTLIVKHEEKETDVALAIKVFEIFHNNECDTAVLVTGDTDLAPAIKTCRALFPGKRIVFCFPFLRKNKELAALAPDSFSINKKQYIKHQLPNPVVLTSGKEIFKPDSW